MTPKQHAVAALELRQPDMVPTFELEFQLEEEMFGKAFLRQEDLRGLSASQKEYRLKANAEYMVHVFSQLEYSIIPVHYLELEDALQTVRYLRELIDDEYMLCAHGDGTYSIPSGHDMVEYSCWFFEHPDEAHAKARQMVEDALERNRKYVDAGLDCFIFCADYCFNDGPFFSPKMFAEFVQPYLADLVARTKELGAYVIKHTDGNIMPILDQLVACEPHALHSLDPMAGVDIAEVKRLVGDKVCLCGNVNCALMQTGTDEEVIASAEYALKHGKPGGGYIFCTSNVPFKGLPPERYQLILDIWKKHRKY